MVVNSALPKHIDAGTGKVKGPTNQRDWDLGSGGSPGTGGVNTEHNLVPVNTPALTINFATGLDAVDAGNSTTDVTNTEPDIEKPWGSGDYHDLHSLPSVSVRDTSGYDNNSPNPHTSPNSSQRCIAHFNGSTYILWHSGITSGLTPNPFYLTIEQPSSGRVAIFNIAMVYDEQNNITPNPDDFCMTIDAAGLLHIVFVEQSPGQTYLWDGIISASMFTVESSPTPAVTAVPLTLIVSSIFVAPEVVISEICHPSIAATNFPADGIVVVYQAHDGNESGTDTDRIFYTPYAPGLGATPGTYDTTYGPGHTVAVSQPENEVYDARYPTVECSTLGDGTSWAYHVAYIQDDRSGDWQLYYSYLTAALAPAWTTCHQDASVNSYTTNPHDFTAAMIPDFAETFSSPSMVVTTGTLLAADGTTEIPDQICVSIAIMNGTCQQGVSNPRRIEVYHFTPNIAPEGPPTVYCDEYSAVNVDPVRQRNGVQYYNSDPAIDTIIFIPAYQMGVTNITIDPTDANCRHMLYYYSESYYATEGEVHGIVDAMMSYRQNSAIQDRLQVNQLDGNPHSLTFDFGYSAAVPTDIGLPVTDPLGGAGILQSYNNAARIWIIDTITGAFTVGQLASVTGGTGSGPISTIDPPSIWLRTTIKSAVSFSRIMPKVHFATFANSRTWRDTTTEMPWYPINVYGWGYLSITQIIVDNEITPRYYYTTAWSIKDIPRYPMTAVPMP